MSITEAADFSVDQFLLGLLQIQLFQALDNTSHTVIGGNSRTLKKCFRVSCECVFSAFCVYNEQQLQF